MTRRHTHDGRFTPGDATLSAAAGDAANPENELATPGAPDAGIAAALPPGMEQFVLALIVCATPSATELRHRGRFDLADAVHAVRARVHSNELVERYFTDAYASERLRHEALS